jgi:hypothetical protein
MFIIEELWKHIKSFLIHNIKIHGKHLQNDPYIKKYNSIIDNLPKFKPYDRGDGPYIIYTSASRSYQFVKFVYTLKYKKIRKIIVTYMLYNPIFSIGNGLQDEVIYREYYNIKNS